MEDKQRESFLFYRDWWESMKDNDAIRYEVYDAIMTKVFDDIEPEVSPMAKMALKFILPVIGRDHDKYNDVREKRKAAIVKRWAEYKKIQDEEMNTKDTNEYKCIQMNTSVTDNVNVNDNVNDNGSLINRDNKDNNKKTPKGVKKEKEVAASEDELFLIAWNAYDRKDNKKSALKAWSKLSQSQKDKCLQVIPSYVKAHKDKKYRPMFSTFINQERFNDEEYITDSTVCSGTEQRTETRQQREQDAIALMSRLAAEDDADEQVRQS